MIRTLKRGTLDWIPKKKCCPESTSSSDCSDSDRKDRDDCCDFGDNAAISGVTVCPSKCGAEVIFANENHTHNPNTSAIFSYQFDGCKFRNKGCPLYYNAELINETEQFEDMTRTYDQVVANTSFIGNAPSVNRILYWPKCNPHDVKVLAAGSEGPGPHTDSLTVKTLIADTVSKWFNLPFESFQMEGILCIDDVHSCNTKRTGTMLFGLNKVNFGNSPMGYQTCVIVGMTYTLEDGLITLDDNPWIVTHTDINYLCRTMGIEQVGGRVMGGGEIGLSSMEYDYCRRVIYVLTSYERRYDHVNDRWDMGGHLWTMAWEPFKLTAGPMESVHDPKTCKPYHFCHKPEGIAKIDKNRMIIVFDDNMVLRGGRFPHQFFYEIVEFVDDYKHYKTYGFGYCKDPYCLGAYGGPEREEPKHKKYHSGKKWKGPHPTGFCHPCVTRRNRPPTQNWYPPMLN